MAPAEQPRRPRAARQRHALTLPPLFRHVGAQCTPCRGATAIHRAMLPKAACQTELAAPCPPRHTHEARDKASNPTRHAAKGSLPDRARRTPPTKAHPRGTRQSEPAKSTHACQLVITHQVLALVAAAASCAARHTRESARANDAVVARRDMVVGWGLTVIPCRGPNPEKVLQETPSSNPPGSKGRKRAPPQFGTAGALAG